MSRVLRLTIATPAVILVDAPRVAALRAEDASGCFGILPGHANFLTVLIPTVIRWSALPESGAGPVERFCAIKGGVLRVSEGARVDIGCREGVTGDSLATLEAQVHAARAEALDMARRARVEDVRLQAQAMRRLLRYLRPRTMPDGAPETDREPAP